jgi:hypothetical protein
MDCRHVMRAVIAAALFCGLAVSSGASAQDASPVAAPGLPPPPENCAVVAQGLWAPRFVAIGDDGSVYVTEAGNGGDETLTVSVPGEAEGTPPPQVTEASPIAEEELPAEEQQEPPPTRGHTGQVTKIAPDGTQSVLTSGLPSYSFGVGPHGIVFADGQLYVAIGGAGVGSGIEPLPEENTIVRIDPATGEATTVASLGQYEVDNNPDGTDINPNLYSIVFVDGTLYVSDAGGNTIYEVDPNTGEFSLLAVVPGLSQLTGATPAAGTPAAEADRQPVPTGLAVDPNGGFFVGLLSEIWPPDAPSILHLDADGTFSDVALGLSAVVALSVDAAGNLYATQLTTDFASETAPGNVLRVAEDGSVETVLDGLVLPHGTAFDDRGNLYVAVISINIAPEPLGQVLQCAGVGEAGMGTPTS